MNTILHLSAYQVRFSVAIDGNPRRVAYDQIMLSTQITLGITLVAIGLSIFLTSLSSINNNWYLFWGLTAAFVVYSALGVFFFARGLHRTRRDYGPSATAPQQQNNVNVVAQPPFAIRDILQIDATVIAGALILLTVSSTSVIPELQKICEVSVALLTGMIVLFFSTSAITAIVSLFSTSESAIRFLRGMSLFWMGFGFFTLLIIMVLVMLNSPYC
jgi:hypothetical protein